MGIYSKNSGDSPSPSLQVVECEMSCLHQKRVMQPQYSCSDFTGVDAGTR